MPTISKIKRPQALLIAGLCVVAPLLPVNPAFATGQTVTITIDNFTFKPEQTIVTPGTTVTWINNDDIPHTIVETKKSFPPSLWTRKTAFPSPSWMRETMIISALCIPI